MGAIGPTGPTGITGATGPTGPAPAGTGTVQVTSGVAGLVSGTASNCVLVNGSSAPCDAPGVTAAVNATPVTVSANSTSAQVLQQLSLPAGFLNTSAASGGAYTYNGSGIYTAAALQTPTLTWTLNLCTVSGCGSGTVRALAVIVTPSVVTATNNTWNIRLAIANTATGATGTVITHGTAIVELTLASDLGTASSDSNTASSGSIDLTAALFLQLTITTSTGNAGNSITEDHSSLEPTSQIGPTGATGPTGSLSSAYDYKDISLGVLQGTSGCSLANSFLTATSPTCYLFSGSTTVSQFGAPQFTATAQALHVKWTLPGDFVTNTPIIFTWVWIDPSDTSSTVTWDVSKYACVAPSAAAIQPTMISGAAAAATSNAGTVNQTATVALTITPSGTGAGNCVGGYVFEMITTLNARSAGTTSPVLVALTAKYYRLLSH